jgi:predicted acyl esterase
LNTLTQYGSYHVDTDEKKSILFRNGHTIQLQVHLNMFPNLSYNELASAAIDKEASMKAYAEAEEKKRKMIIPGASRSGG